MLVGKLLDRLGAVTEIRAVPGGPVGFEARTRHRLVPVELRSMQRTVALDIDHDHSRTVGRVEHLRQVDGGDVWIVATVERDIPTTHRYLSAEYRATLLDAGVHGDARLVGVARDAGAPTRAALRERPPPQPRRGVDGAPPPLRPVRRRVHRRRRPLRRGAPLRRR